jgi:hypothetical protein
VQVATDYTLTLPICARCTVRCDISLVPTTQHCTTLYIIVIQTTGELEFKQMPGPIWKSLCQPAILPLTTDYLPSREVLEKNYTESFYTLTLPDSDDPIAKHYSCDMDLLEELICQRIAQVCVYYSTDFYVQCLTLLFYT